MGTEVWVLKGTKLITNTKKQKLKIQSRGWIFKNTILKKRRRRKKTKITKIIKIYIYEVCFKKQGLFFCEVIVGYKNENGVIDDLKIKNKKIKE